MADERQGRGTIAILGATAVAVVLGLLGVLNWGGGEKQAATEKTAQVPVSGAAGSSRQAESQAPTSTPKPAPSPVTASNQAPKPADSKATPVAPSFDIVRVEPTGDSVIAGRAAPGATIELLRDDQVHARGVADASGLFAITPPPLPPGSHQIVLQSIAPDGTRQRSRESVTVAINGDSRPLVALAAPDKPTVLLSNPEPPAPKPAEPPKTEAKTTETPTPEPQKQANAEPPVTPPAAAPTPPAQPASRAEIKITSVESEPGRLYVSGQASPGATVRLYLNETFVAPGGAGSDGKLSFAIASGVRPGDYRVRLDDVDPVSGQVKSRAEVAYNVPVETAAPQLVQGQATPDAIGAQAKSSPAQASSTGASSSSQPNGGRVASALPDGTAVPSAVVVPNIETAIVSRGDSLWRISQRIYGRGMRYTVIYGANQKQIRDPDLIYPGQVFVLPSDQTKGTN
ncbi:LysM peptidoglycan-binding domain-containing protein [Microvirga puerhi]|uniref:LysM peptidoglycan-binding domain-containing protein n=1 Tax=Microvirga puerhi TaxID=2876078 RepID=A0ABS7VMN4_9HYPH|nr:LysM peptidoglycan-binding domain-containing protein [Microvirga puerhi]MBZ6076494.1 LysM peptidoglycan-binding domain-containing protein [Microvirga puerhi]